ncbi:MAG: YhgE/Pip domain-containing protein [Rubrivivax sp.]
MKTAWRGTVWWQLACVDARLLLRDPRLVLAALGIVLVPAVYALIYLTSVWNPAARTGALPVLVVNADRGADFQGQSIRLGDELVRRMRERPTFGYELTADEAEARHAVASGRAQFAVLIASDFSQRALPGTEAGAARIVIYTSEGNDYSGAGFAKRFAPELARQVNEALNRERWTLVLQKAAGAQVSLDELHAGVQRLLGGARELSQGAGQLRQGASELQRAMGQAQEGAGALRQGSTQAAAGGSRLADGMRRLGSGLRSVVARLPADAELQAVLSASEAMAQGQVQLGQGLLQLHDGALQLEDGAGRFKAEGERLLLVGDRVAAGAGQLQEGLGRLATGLGEAREAQVRLADGQGRLQSGTRALVEGLLPLSGGLRQMAQSLPPDDELQRLSQGLAQLEGGAAALGGGLQGAHGGTQKLAAGLQRLEGGAQALSTGLQALAGALPAASPLAGGSAGGLAGSVQPVVEVVAPVPASGAGFAPNFIAVALWVGATLCTFLWPLRRLPELPVPVKDHALATVLGKLAMPALLAGLQALAVLVMIKTLLPAPMPGGWRLLATLLVAAFTFLAILLALVRLLGETGKAVALLLLVTQISAAGGTLPVALTTDFHRAIHPFLPFTWVIRALRAAMFGAYEGAWAPAIGALAAGGVVALAAAVWLGRWKRVPLADYRPALEID